MSSRRRDHLPTLILASESPRRIELLSQLGISFRVLHGRFRESLPSLPVEEAARLLAWRKADTARRKMRQGLIVTADTVVALGDVLFGKPRSPADARSQLEQLSGRTHEVVTAVTILDAHTGCGMLGSERSLVTFKRLTARQIAAYVATGEPLDKAGSYAVQSRIANVVARVAGDYFNVVGLPVKLFASLAARFGLRIPPARIAALYKNPPKL